MMRLDGYIRVSRVGGRSGETFISPDVQRESIERWAQLRGVTIAEWHTDLDQSGGKLSRPGLDQMMERVRTGETGGIAVARLDRLSRAGVSDALTLVEEVIEAGGQLAVVDLGIDPTTPFGEFAMTIMLALARMERRRIADNWQVAQGRAVARGVHFHPAVGYDRGETGRLVANEWAPFVREVFARRATGTSWTALSRFLNEHRVPTTTGSAWQPRGVTHLVEKRVYLGESYHGDHRHVDAHERLVDRATWEVANRREVAINDGVTRLLSGGVLRCAGCRHTLKAARGKSNGRVLEQYRCKGQHASGRCLEPATIVSHLVEPYVEQAFLDRIATQVPEFVPAERTDRMEAAKAALADAECEVDDFAADLEARRMLGVDRWRASLRLRIEAADVSRQRVAELGAELLGESPDPQTILRAWPTLSVDDRRQLIAESVGMVVVKRVGRGKSAPVEDRVAILFRGDPRIPEDLPRRGGRAVHGGPLRPFWPCNPVEVGRAATKELAEGA